MLRSSGRQVAIQTTGRPALPRIDQHKVDISAEQRAAIDRRAGPLPAQLIGTRIALGQTNDRSWRDCVEEVSAVLGLIGRCEPRERGWYRSGWRQMHRHRDDLAILRRFWAVAARRNSSLAPFGPRRRNRSGLRIRLRWANSISTFFRCRRDSNIGIGERNSPRLVASCFMDRAHDLACRHVGRAILL